MSSNPATAVALWQGALARRFILIAKSFGGDSKPSVPCIGESHPMHVKEPTSLIAKRQGEIPMKWSVKHTENGVYDVDPSWFTLEGYTQQCVNLQTTSTRHLNMPYERKTDQVF